MTHLEEQVRRVADSNRFSGAVRVHRNGVVELDAAFGMADRSHGIAAETTTRFATASGSKGFTALAVIDSWRRAHCSCPRPCGHCSATL